MYYKIEVAKARTSLIEESALQITASQRRDKKYKPIYLSRIRKFIKKPHFRAIIICSFQNKHIGRWFRRVKKYFQLHPTK